MRVSALPLLLIVLISSALARKAESAEYLFEKSDAEISEHLKRYLGAYSNTATEYGSYWVEETNDQEMRSDTFRYDSVLTTIAAGLESRHYDRGKWQEIFVSAEQAELKNPYYQKPVRFFHKAASVADDKFHPLVIVLGSSFSTWKRGTWTNKIVASIEKVSREPVHFVAMPGFLTPEVLAHSPKFPDPSGVFVARDLRIRLFALLRVLSESGVLIKTNQIYIMGYSGGAGIALEIAGLDGKSDRSLVTGGVLAFSPVVDLATANRVLDSAQAEAHRLGIKAGLTTPGSLVKGLFDPPSVNTVLRLQGTTSAERNSKRETLSHMFYNEFTTVDLKTVADSSQSRDFAWGPQAQGKSGNSYKDYFETYAVAKMIQEGAVPVDTTFESLVDVVPRWSRIRTKNLIVFALDDPVLAKNSFDGHPQPNLEKRLNRLKTEASNLKLFLPKRGGHMGYFIDTKWLQETLRDFVNN